VQQDTETQGPLHCPRDHKELKTRSYEAEIEIDECLVCGGIWLDQGELEAIQKTVERDYKREISDPVDTISEGNESARQRAREGIRCPKCDAEMVTKPYGYGSQIVIDVCPSACGVWLDHGELEALEQHFERSQQDYVMPLRLRLWAAVHKVLHRR